MPRTDDPYSRVYWRAVDDPRFEHVWHDDHALAWWLRLLIAADQAWPASAALPHGVHKGALRLLTESGLVEVTGYRYRIHGLDKERERRANAGRTGGLASGNVRSTNVRRSFNHRSPIAESVGEPSQEETRQEEPRRDEHNGRAGGEELDGIDLFRDGLPHLDEATLSLGRSITGKPAREAGDRQLDELDRQLGEYGPEKVRSAMRRVPAYEGKVTWQRLVWGTRKVLEPLWEGGKPESPAEREDRERRERAARLNAEAEARRAAAGAH